MKYKFRSLSNIVDHIPSKNNPVCNSYDNKLLSEWDSDDFASFVLDRCDSNNKLPEDEKYFLFLYQIVYLDYIPVNYARVYLYGVWEVVKEMLDVNSKLKTA
jgi:hypothetical protein